MFAIPLALAWDHAADRFGRLGRAGLVTLYVVLTVLSVELQVVKHLARWVRDGEFWIPRFTGGGDVGPTVVHFFAWAFPHPIAAALVLAGGLVLAGRLDRSQPAG
jgi:hypothetical protein